MNIDRKLIDRFFEGNTSPEENGIILFAISFNPELEEYFITRKRLAYVNEQIEDYGSFIPASSMAADDGRNLCDLQCETFILKKEGIDASSQDLACESRKNYWLRAQGTPLFNMGKLLETKGFLVNRVYDASLDVLIDRLKEHSAIVVVNGDVLDGKQQDILSDDFSLDSTPNHAVVVQGVNQEKRIVSIFNPANDEGIHEYNLEVFLDAWKESSNYLVTVRKKSNPYEYCPQPINVNDIELSPELLELVELLCENAHDDWAITKQEIAAKDGFTVEYDSLDRTDKEKKVIYSHYFVPYAMLTEIDKSLDKVTVTNTIKRLKRLGYRLVNINSMYRCPDCGEVIEPSNNFCPNCGKQLTWEVFK